MKKSMLIQMYKVAVTLLIASPAFLTKGQQCDCPPPANAVQKQKSGEQYHMQLFYEMIKSIAYKTQKNSALQNQPNVIRNKLIPCAHLSG